MSGTIGSGPMMPTGLLATLSGESASIKRKLDILTQQSASGQVSSTYAGLGNQASVSINLGPQLQQIGTWQNNLSQAGTNLQMTQAGLQQLSAIASNFATQTLNMSAQTSQGIGAIAIQAQAALTQVEQILNTQSGGAYLFAGTDSANPPLTDANLAAFVAAVQAPIAGLTAINGAATVTATLAAASTTTLTTASGARAMAQTGPGQLAAIGVVAGQNAYAVQAGAGTTGSYVKDLVASLATLAATNSGQTALGSGFTALTTSVGATLNGVVAALGTEISGVGAQQAQLTAQSSDLSALSTTLTAQISSVENVDMASTATALTQVQNQLQASYQLISGMKNLSLAAFLVPGG